MRRPALSLIVLMLVVFGLGCAVKPDANPHRHLDFPSETELDELAARELPAQKSRSRMPKVLHWDLEGPLPSRAGSLLVEGRGLSGKLIRDLEASGTGALATLAHQCRARQLGRFFLDRDTWPPPSLELFISSRCGVTTTTRQRVSGIEFDADTAQPWIRGQLREAYAQHMAGLELEPGTEVGVWAHIEDTRAILVTSFGQRYLDFKAVPMSIEGTSLVIEGKMRPGVEWVRALANRGKFGFERCETLPTWQDDEFRLECELSRHDADGAYIGVSHFQEGRWLGHEHAMFLVTPGGGDPPTRWWGPPADDLDLGDSMEWLGAINQLRQRLGLRSLLDAPKQRALAEELMPLYLAVRDGRVDPEIADTVALGLQAGYGLPRLIRSSSFFGGEVFSGARGGLPHLLESPVARATLLDPRDTDVAVALAPRRDHAMAMFTTYSYFLENPDYDQAEHLLLDHLDRERRFRGLGDIIRVGGEGSDTEYAMAFAIEHIKEGEVPRYAMRDALNWIAGKLGVRLLGQVRITNDLESMRFPQLLYRVDNPVVALKIDHYDPPGSPWGAYVVMMFVGTDEDM